MGILSAYARVQILTYSFIIYFTNVQNHCNDSA